MSIRSTKPSNFCKKSIRRCPICSSIVNRLKRPERELNPSTEETMPITIQWLCEGHVIYGHYSGDITVDEIAGFSATLHEMVESSDAPLVHMVSDVSQLG